MENLFKDDNRIVMTLDAGGTNFVFSAIKNAEQIIKPIRLNLNAKNLEKCLAIIILGFEKVKEKLKENPIAISFASPGPADYSNGIIGDLQNLPAFKGGVALGPMLSEHFKMPVYINNDGNLFALGESLFGFLPKINEQMKSTGSLKYFKNLIGIALGTGFGFGLTCNGQLLVEIIMHV
jgi:glucokinase